MPDNKLKECPNSPNCVSTQTEQIDKRMPPIPFDQDVTKVLTALKGVIAGFPQTQLVREDSHYLHFTFKSKLFGFIDNVEFLVDEGAKLIHFRSASKVGYSDFGANRKRMTQVAKMVHLALQGTKSTH